MGVAKMNEMIKEGMKIKIALTNRLFYKGIVKGVNETHIMIIDKYGSTVMINKNNILILEVIP